MNEPHGRGSRDDIYDDLDSFFNPESACVTDSIQEDSSKVSDFTKTSNTTMGIPSDSSSTSNFGLNEDQLKKEEMILYLDLVVTEMDNKKTLMNVKAEYIKLKEEFDSLRKSLKEKDEKISQLTAENATLKKNICSLYKTAKSEIDQKDAMLQEANKRIDKMRPWRERSAIQNEHSVESSQCQPSTSRMSSVPSQNSIQYEAHYKSKEGQDYNNYRKRNYEASDSENPPFSRPSTSYNPAEHHSKWNRVNSKHRFSYHQSEKRKHSPSGDAINEKCNTNNYTDRRNSFNKSKNNQNIQRNERNPKRQRHDS